MSMIGYSFLCADMRSRHGDEPAWEIGEERRVRGRIALCERGYHGCLEPGDLLIGGFIYGPVIAKWEFGEVVFRDPNDCKFVSASRRLLAAVNVGSELRLFAIECAERVLPIFEKCRPDDRRPCEAIETARRYLKGEAKERAFRVAADAADAAAYAASASAAVSADADAYISADAAAYAASASAAVSADADAYAASISAAYASAARKLEREWQRTRFNELMLSALKERK